MGTYLIVLEPVEAVRAEDEPVLSGGSLDEGDRDTEPPLADQLVAGGPSSSLLVLGGPVEPNEVWMVCVHIGQLYLNHQLQLRQRERERDRDREREREREGEKERERERYYSR